MKKIIIALSLIASLAATAQTSTNAPVSPQQSFVNSVGSYFSSFDTNSVTFSQPADLWIAENYRSGVNSSAEIGASYDLWKVSTNLVVAPEGIIRNAGIAGVVVGEQIGAGLSYRKYDVKVTGYLDLGYSQFDSQPYAEFGLRAKKALTANTYAGVGIGIQKLFGASKASGVNTTSLLPTVTVFTGFTF